MAPPVTRTARLSRLGDAVHESESGRITGAGDNLEFAARDNVLKLLLFGFVEKDGDEGRARAGGLGRKSLKNGRL